MVAHPPPVVFSQRLLSYVPIGPGRPTTPRSAPAGSAVTVAHKSSHSLANPRFAASFPWPPVHFTGFPPYDRNRATPRKPLTPHPTQYLVQSPRTPGVICVWRTSSSIDPPLVSSLRVSRTVAQVLLVALIASNKGFVNPWGRSTRRSRQSRLRSSPVPREVFLTRRSGPGLD